VCNTDLFFKKIEQADGVNEVTHPSMSYQTQVFHAPSTLTTKSLYADRREFMRVKEQKENDNELDCPILFTPITAEDVAFKRAITVAKFGQNGTLAGIGFISSAALTEWFKTRQTHPLTNQPLGMNPLKKRAEYAMKLFAMEGEYSMNAGAPFDLTSEQIQELFPIFLKNSATFHQNHPLEHAWMQCHLKLGDTGIHMTFPGTTGEQRTAALAYLADKPVGTGVFRLSSIESTNAVECFAISYVVNEQKTARTANGPVVIQAAKIRHIAVAHVMGYGYTIIEAAVGQKLPELDATGQSNGVSLPLHDDVWPSLLDLLKWLHINATNFNLSRMVLQA
jgi:hypothetical protein